MFYIDSSTSSTRRKDFDNDDQGNSIVLSKIGRKHINKRKNEEEENNQDKKKSKKVRNNLENMIQK